MSGDVHVGLRKNEIDYFSKRDVRCFCYSLLTELQLHTTWPQVWAGNWRACAVARLHHLEADSRPVQGSLTDRPWPDLACWEPATLFLWISYIVDKVEANRNIRSLSQSLASRTQDATLVASVLSSDNDTLQSKMVQAIYAAFTWTMVYYHGRMKISSRIS
ncbi:hypothetical protein ACFE04_006844 [Oxalis oulophora]